MIPEGLDFDVENNSNANAAGTSAIVFDKTGAAKAAINGMLMTQQRIDDWSKQKQAEKAQQLKELNDKVKLTGVDDKGIFDKDVPYFIEQRKQLEDLGAQTLLAAKSGTESPDFIKAQTEFNKKKDQIQSEFEASKQHRNNFVEQTKLLGNDGKGGKAPVYNHDQSVISMDQYHQMSLPERIKADQNMLKTADFDMDGYIRGELLKADPKSGLNKFQEQNAEVVHEKGTDYVKTTANYGKDLAGEREYEYSKEPDGKGFKYSKKLKDDPEAKPQPLTKTTYDFETKRVSDASASGNPISYDKVVTPEHVIDATEFAINNKPQVKDRIYNEWAQIMNTKPTDPNYQQNQDIAKVFVDAAAAKTLKTGKLVTPEVLYGAVHYVMPAAQEQVSIKELHENGGTQAYMKEDAKVRGKLAAIQPIANSTVDMLRAVWTGQDKAYNVDANGNKYTEYLTGKQWGPMADGKTIDNAVGLVIHSTTADGNPLLLIQTPNSKKEAKAAIASMAIPVQNDIDALNTELKSATPQKKAVIQQQLANKQVELEKIAKMPGSGFMQVTDMGQAVQAVISGQPSYNKDAGTIVSLANEYGRKNGWFDPKSATWAGIKTAQGQTYKNLTLEEAQKRLPEVESKLSEIQTKYEKLGDYKKLVGNPKKIADGLMSEHKALQKEKGDLVQKIGVNVPTNQAGEIKRKTKDGKIAIFDANTKQFKRYE